VDLEYVIGRLRANATVFDALFTSVDPGDVDWRPSPGVWSLLEVANHLADEEVEDFRTRVDLTLHEPDVDWPPIDPEGWVTARAYADREFEASVTRFLEARAASIAWLSALEAPDWSRYREHPVAGRLAAGDVLTAWLAHDYLHLRQIAVRHHQLAGDRCAPFQPEYAGSL